MEIIGSKYTVTVEQDTVSRVGLVIEVLDYGDEYYDVQFSNRHGLVGDAVMAGIPGYKKAMEIAEDYSKQSGGIPIVVRQEMDLCEY